MNLYRLALIAVAVLWAAASGLAGSTGAASSQAQSARDGKIAFVRNGTLFTVASDGSGVRRLQIVSKLRNLDCDGPAWAPDGRRLAFTAYHEGDGVLFVRSATGRANALGSTGRGEGGVSWSPDGKQLVVGAGGDEPSLGLYSVSSGGATAIGVEGFDPAWSPDGAAIAYRFGRG